jgi:hypothetical protein
VRKRAQEQLLTLLPKPAPLFPQFLPGTVTRLNSDLSFLLAAPKVDKARSPAGWATLVSL